MELSNELSHLVNSATGHDLFIMHNDDINGNTNPHVTVNELKDKLQQFKQQLKLVQTMYGRNSGSDENTNRNFQSKLTINLKGGSSRDGVCDGHSEDSCDNPNIRSSVVNTENSLTPDETYLNCHGNIKTERFCDTNIESDTDENNNIIETELASSASSSSGVSSSRIPLKKRDESPVGSRIPRKKSFNSKKQTGNENSCLRKTAIKARHQDKNNGGRKIECSSEESSSMANEGKQYLGSGMESSDTECDGNLKLRARARRKDVTDLKSKHLTEINELRNSYEEKFKEFQKDLSERASVKELSLSLKLKYLEQLNLDLQHKCSEYETQWIIFQQEMKTSATKSCEVESKNYKLSLDHAHLSAQHNQLLKEKHAIETELCKSQQMLNESFRLRKEAEECLLTVQRQENTLSGELNDARKLNEHLQSEIIALQKIFEENDKKLEYFQRSEAKLQKSLNEAIVQISELEQQTKEKDLDSKLEYQKLLHDHEKLLREHETVKVLYADSIKKIQESMKEIELLKINGSRNLESAENIVQDRPVRKFSIRKTWFDHHPVDKQFEQPEKITENSDASAGEKTRIPRRAHTFHNDCRRPSYIFNQISPELHYESDHSYSRSTSGGSDVNVSLSEANSVSCVYKQSLSASGSDSAESFDGSSQSLLSITSCDQNKSTTSLNEKFLDVDIENGSRVHDFIGDSYHSNSNNNNYQSSCKGSNDREERSRSSPDIRTWYVPVNGDTDPKTDTNSKIGRVKKHFDSAAKADGQARSATPSKIPARFNRTSMLRKTMNLRFSSPTAACASSSIPKVSRSNSYSSRPGGSRRGSYANPTEIGDLPTPQLMEVVTTDQVLAAVKETTIEPKRRKAVTNNPITSRILQQNQNCGGTSDARENDVSKLETQLKNLNLEKEQVEFRLGRIPTRSSGRLSRQQAEEESTLEARCDQIMSELASVRSALKSHHAL